MMRFVDASLLYAAATTGVREVWTLDSDFLVYRLRDGERLQGHPGRIAARRLRRHSHATNPMPPSMTLVPTRISMTTT